MITATRSMADRLIRMGNITALLVATLLPVFGRAELLGVEPITGDLPLFDGHAVREPRPEDEFPPLRVLLSRRRYWAQDGHLDVVAQLVAPDGETLDGELRGRILDAAGAELSTFTIAPLPGAALIAYPAIPAALLEGGAGVLEMTWQRDGTEIAHVREPFRVERFVEPAPRAGRVRLSIANEPGTRMDNLPVTVGVPFPRGVLTNTAHLRLLDASGMELPLQVMETARWSKFGSVKWVLCDFTVALDGGPRDLFLEYGNRVSGVGCREPSLSVAVAPGTRHATLDTRGEYAHRAPAVDGRRWASMSVDSPHTGFPRIDAGRLRFDNGLWFDTEGDGQFVQVLDAAALSGAFVEHEDGRVYRPDPATPFVVEETGPEKIVLRREGWYVEAAAPTHSHTHPPTHTPTHTPKPTHPRTHTPTHSPPSPNTFCQYITRYVIHRGSPLVRVFHTWVFTGDGNRDRIRNMGWRFNLVGEGRNGAFLTAFDAAGDWTPGESLLQYDYEHFDISAGEGVTPYPGGRAAGAARVDVNGARLYFGAKDFWQNYPSELEFRDGAFWFHNWPRHNKPARYTFDKQLIVERGKPAASSSAARYAMEAPDKLTRSEWTLNAIQARHAHEGIVLDFRLPDAYGEDPIWTDANQREAHWDRGNVETVNAQGVARTEEFWLFVADANTAANDARALLQGLNDATLRAVVDPAWLAASGAFYEIHPHDPELFPREEAVYERVALSPGRVAERLGIYGMWIYGDIPAWNLRLEIKEPVLYRAYRKRHLGWPYPWMPFARSGDARFFKAAEAATRQIIDGGYCHYVSDEVRRALGPERGPLRRPGLWHRGLVPWGSRTAPIPRGYEQRADFLLDAWYLTGNRRARDQIAANMEMIRYDPAMPLDIGPGLFGRMTSALLKSCVQLYEATFDPWFLAAAHAFSQGHLHGRTGETADRRYGGRLWDTGDREFLRFTGSPEFREFYLNRHVKRAVSERVWSNWNRRKPMYAPNAFAWKLTGDEYYLRRAEYDVENTIYNAGDWNVYARRMRTEPQEEWQKGIWEGNSFGAVYTFFTPACLRWFPHALWALAEAGHRPAPIYTTFNAVLPERAPDDADQRLTLAFRKAPDVPLKVLLGFGTDRHLGPLPRPPKEYAVDYTLTAPDGVALQTGVWSHVRELEIPDAAGPGTYRLTLRYPDAFAAEHGSSRVFGLPATETGLPEVILPGPDAPTPCVGWRSLWFRVPEAVERFTVLQSGPSATILNADGDAAWRATDAGESGDMLVAVPPGQAGRLWHVTVPGYFQLDTTIPAVYAVEPDRWFMPPQE